VTRERGTGLSRLLNQILKLSKRQAAEVDPDRDEVLDLRAERDKAMLALAEMITQSLDLVGLQVDLDDVDSLKKLVNKQNFYSRFLEESMKKAGVSVVPLIGQEYSPGLKVEPVNIADFQPTDALEIGQVVRPMLIIRASSYDEPKLLQSGRVYLKIKEQN
jgi:hypothetical protein